MTILVTGAAGFIGFHLARRLLLDGEDVIGLDNFNDYYSPALKQARVAEIHKEFPNWQCVDADICDADAIQSLFMDHNINVCLHMAAQAGVRYSLENPRAYIDSNVVGFLNILEACRKHGIDHLVYASSSSVYGDSTELPYRVGQPIDRPVSLYAATKQANESMAHVYSHLYDIPTTGLRFFTVYGPWGRPDMSPMLFASAMLVGEPIQLFNEGNHARDFTYIDDVVESVVRLIEKPPEPQPRWQLYNVGNSNPVALKDYVAMIEGILGKTAQVELLPRQPGDVEQTFADCQPLADRVGYSPQTPLQQGLQQFLDWYRDFYELS